MQGWNNHAYSISATVSVSRSPRSDIKAMSIDEGSPDSRPSRKTSSKMSIDPSPLPGARRKTSSRMSVDTSPNVYHSTQRRTSSRMSVDVPSARRSRGSSDRMLLDEIQQEHHLPQQADPFTARPTASLTMGYPHSASTCTSREHVASGVVLPTSFPMTVSQKMSLSYDPRSPRGEANLMLMSSAPPPSSFQQHIQRKEKHKVSPPATSTPLLPCISQSPARTSMLPLRQLDSAPVAPHKPLFPKHETPASRHGSRSPSTKRETIHSPTSRGRVRARGSSSGDEVSHKRYCVRQDSRPIALPAIDPHSACVPSLQPLAAQSLSPIDEVWLPPMEQQLEKAHQSQLKAKFRKFKAIIGGAVNEIKQAIVPYNKDHRKHKVARIRSGSRPFAGVPDYLRSAERPDPVVSTSARCHEGTPFGIGKDIDSIAETWTNLALCDSPTSSYGDDGAIHGEALHLSLPPNLPRINKPPENPCSSRPASRTAVHGSVTHTQSDDEVEIYISTAANLAAPTFRQHRTADAFDARGVVIPRPPNNNSPHRKSSRSTKM
jgi:hypothetical protein